MRRYRRYDDREEDWRHAPPGRPRDYYRGYPYDQGGYERIGPRYQSPREQAEGHWDDYERGSAYGPGSDRYGPSPGREYEDRLYQEAPDYDLNDYTRGVYDRGFYDRGYPSPRSWIGDRDADRVPRMDYPEGGRGGEYSRPREYDVRHRYGKGRNNSWDDREGRVEYLPNANVW